MTSRSAAAALAVAAFASGCGGQPRPQEVKASLAEPEGCVVNVFFATEIRSGRGPNAAEMRNVRRRLATSSAVRTFSLVSKRLALRRMRARHPELSRDLPANPLPDAYEIVPRSADDAQSLMAELSDFPGIEHTNASRAC